MVIGCLFISRAQVACGLPSLHHGSARPNQSMLATIRHHCDIFLRPDVCPILDTTISQSLGYVLDEHGYKQLSDDCLRIADALQQCEVNNPMGRESERWFAADVEMALFAYLSKDSLAVSRCRD